MSSKTQRLAEVLEELIDEANQASVDEAFSDFCQGREFDQAVKYAVEDDLPDLSDYVSYDDLCMEEGDLRELLERVQEMDPEKVRKQLESLKHRMMQTERRFDELLKRYDSLPTVKLTRWVSGKLTDFRILRDRFLRRK